jgi:hypothetical protein
MLEDVEQLFDVSGTWCCCFLDTRLSMLGHRNSKDRLGIDTYSNGSSAESGLNNSSSPLFDPSYLHKYSGEMRCEVF